MHSRGPLALTPASRLTSQQSVAGDCLIPFQNPSGIKTSSIGLDQGGQRYPCPEKKSAVLGCPPLMSAWVPISLATHYGAGEHLPLYMGGLTCKYIDPASWWWDKSTVQHRQRAGHRARHKARTRGTSSFFLQGISQVLLYPPPSYHSAGPTCWCHQNALGEGGSVFCLCFVWLSSLWSPGTQYPMLPASSWPPFAKGMQILFPEATCNGTGTFWELFLNYHQLFVHLLIFIYLTSIYWKLPLCPQLRLRDNLRLSKSVGPIP